MSSNAPDKFRFSGTRIVARSGQADRPKPQPGGSGGSRPGPPPHVPRQPDGERGFQGTTPQSPPTVPPKTQS